MAELVHHIDIDRPPADVFAVATNPQRFPEWQKDVAQAQYETGDPAGIGAVFSTSRRIGGMDVTQRQQVTENAPPHRWTAHGITGPIRAHATVAVEPLDEGARSHVTFTLDFDGPGLGRLMIPQVRRMAAKAAPSSHQNLKDLLEAD
ncbi:MAG: SRPBCC family protein [Nocardioidaceae bacterium]